MTVIHFMILTIIGVSLSLATKHKVTGRNADDASFSEAMRSDASTYWLVMDGMKFQPTVGLISFREK